MIHIYNELCSYCGSCVAVCPENIIELVDLHLEIDQPQCTHCAKCIKGCPVGALAMEYRNKLYYPEYEGRGLF